MGKLTKIERNWILYDVGNSAFILIVSTIIPIYFKNIASTEGISAADSTAYWGYAASLATVIVMLLGPTLGALGDRRDFKNKLFVLFAGLGAVGCFFLSTVNEGFLFLGIFIVGKVGFSMSLIFYDAMLNDITTPERIDDISSKGYAFGYIGSIVPFVIALLFIMKAELFGITAGLATKISFIMVAIWWVAFTIPLERSYRKNFGEKIHRDEKLPSLGENMQNWKRGILAIKENKKVATFLLAFFLYIDGVYTIIEMATSYGKDMGISDNNLLFALLLTQAVGFPFAILFGKLAKKHSAERMIKVCIIGYIGVALFALQLDKAWEFWFLAVVVAMFQGGIQALSRSYFSKIIPKERTNEFFSFYDIFGKGAAFTGTLLMSLVTQISGNSKFGLASILLLLFLGIAAFRRHTEQFGVAAELKNN